MMAASNLLRWSGLAALVGSVLIVVANVVAFLGGVNAGTISRGVYFLVASLFLPGLGLVLLGLVGLYASRAQATGALGLIRPPVGLPRHNHGSRALLDLPLRRPSVRTRVRGADIVDLGMGLGLVDIGGGYA